MKRAIVFVLVACGGPSEPAKPPPPPSANVTFSQFAKRDDAMKVDMVGPADGALKPDGHPDAAFDVTLRGPIIALLVDSENDNSWQWDTYTGLQTVPVEMQALAPKGSMTGGIGVFENGKPINDPNGGLLIDDEKEHHLVIYIADNGAFQAGSSFKIYGETKDHKIVHGPVAKF